jgi:hypothetical protein
VIREQVISSVIVNNEDLTGSRLGASPACAGTVAGQEGMMSDADTQQPARRQRSDRANLVPVPFWTSPGARRQLRILAAEEETTQQRLIAEALNLLFSDRRRDPCA